MAIVFESDNYFLTSDDCIMVNLEYILFQFRQNLDSKKLSSCEAKIGEYLESKDEEILVQMLLDNSNQDLRMYGSASEFAEQLKIYRNFPESHKFFGANATNSYYTTPIVYHNSKNEKFVCKPDLFVYLQNLAFHKTPTLKTNIFRTLLAIFLKSQEEKITKKLEFVRYDSEVFKEIEDEIEESMKCFPYTLKDEFELPSTIAINSSIDEIYEKWKKLIPTVWKEEFGCVKKYLESIYNGLEPEERIDGFDYLFFNCKNLIKTFQNIIGKRPEMFLLYSETKNNELPITVRLFEDGSQKFVMKAELYQAMNIESQNHDMCVYHFDAVEMNDVFKKFGNQVQGIEFIHVPILRAKHRAVPLKGPDSEEFYMLAVDALFDLLKHIIFGVQFFQKANNMQTEIVLLLKQLGVLFSPYVENRFFVKMSAYYIHKNLINDGLKPCETLPAKPIRNAKKDGFTVENLKNELKHLGLTDSFPEITDYAEIVYAEVSRVKKEKFLRTCDLFDAIEHCQLICIFDRAPNLKKFLHNQKSCGRVLTLKCDSCIETSSNTSSAENADSQKVPKISEPTDSMKPKISAEVGEESDQKETPATVPPQNNGSDICEECLQTTVILNVTEKKLKSLEKTIEELKSELSERNAESDDLASLNKIIGEKLILAKKENENEHRKRVVIANGQIMSENKELKQNVSKLEGINNQLKENNSKFERKVSDIEKNLVDVKKKSDKYVQEKAKEIKNLKENHSRISKENDGLKLKISKFESNEAQLKEENSKQELIFAESQRNLQEKVSHLEQNLNRKDQTFCKTQTDLQERISYLENALVSEKQTSENLNKEIIESKEKSARDKANEEQKWMDERRRFEEELQEKARQINEFHESNIRLKTENEVNGRIINQLMDKLANSHNSASSSEPYSSTWAPTPHLHQSNVSNSYFQPIYSLASHNMMGSHAPSTSNANMNFPFTNEQKKGGTDSAMYDRQIPDPFPPSEHHPALINQYQRHDSDKHLQVHSDSILGNRAHSTLVFNENSSIKMPEKQNKNNQKTTANSELGHSEHQSSESLQTSSGSVAENCAPSKSSHTPPMEIREEPIKNDQRAPSNTELGDSECLICVSEMRFRQKTIKCHQCRRRYHSDCASKWLKVKSECPACRGRLLDPYEFPLLS